MTSITNMILALILVFEWWYFRTNGCSFIEQMSLNHLGPWINPDDPQQPNSERVRTYPLLPTKISYSDQFRMDLNVKCGKIR